jgi:hypothetical protein
MGLQKGADTPDHGLVVPLEGFKINNLYTQTFPVTLHSVNISKHE